MMRQYGTMPTKNAIAEKTGLSRQTVAKHLKEYQRHPEFTAEMEQFKFMAPSVLAGVFKNAINGDTKAARLYLEMAGTMNKQTTNTVINEQNNYIQINNTILSQENLNQLTADQLNQIESIVMNRR
jgi:predicted transcriptional regulator